MKTLSALSVRKKFGSILDDVYKNKSNIVISRANKPLAVIIPFDQYQQQIEKRNREKRLRLTLTNINHWRKKYKNITKNINSTLIIRKMRETL